MPGVPEAGAIRFGTDGWRDVIADGYTFPNVRRVTRALCDVLREASLPPKLVVGYDTRFLSPRFAAAVAETASARGFDVWLTPRATPTPAVSWATRDLVASAGVMITASHNPPEYNGFKVKGPFGGPALEAFTRRVERRLAEVGPGEIAPAGAAVGTIHALDPTEGYFEQVKRLLGPGLIARSRGRWVVDAMHGAGSGWLTRALREAGVECLEIRGDINPAFGGVNPEPVAVNLGALRKAVIEAGAEGGLALDGDGDRLGVVDEHGQVVDSQRVFSLLLRHLADRRGMRGTVVKTFAVTDMIDELARSRGLPLAIRPVGFKHVTEFALHGDLLLGGEESGGFGIGAHLPERDGVLCGLLVVEACAAAGTTLSGLVDGLVREVGPRAFGRADLHLDPERAARVMETLSSDPPATLAGFDVTDLERLDGLKLRLGREGWILFRASGTEPLIRVYAETSDDRQLRSVLDEGRRLAGGAP